MTKSISQEEIEKIRNDFPMLRNVKEMQNHRFCYLDNGATTFKPDCVIKLATHIMKLGMLIHIAEIMTLLI